MGIHSLVFGIKSQTSGVPLGSFLPIATLAIILICCLQLGHLIYVCATQLGHQHLFMSLPRNWVIVGT